ncbi:unnamed protein product [Linum tenue]|uniref:Leucine-rich repeat-containing N-terminal plant-type domain-containing protein n=1 Tax=Linum tenue TaxID=586396 RepID=A0AAV0LVB4_9ROSI|nr:unnamed protein product [Linum tenue]
MAQLAVSLLFLISTSLFPDTISALTEVGDLNGLKSLEEAWGNTTPPNWLGNDPCGSSRRWDGVTCTNSRVTSLQLSGMGLKGYLPSDIALLPELRTLDLSFNKGLEGPLPPSIGDLRNLTTLILAGCSFSGSIPATVGSLTSLAILSLEYNAFTGQIPPEIGNLTNLSWLDLSYNQLVGNIPVSTADTPGLDSLLNLRHLHVEKNYLSGTIPNRLFSSATTLVSLLLDGNSLTGSIPSSLGLVQNLEVIRLDRNRLTGTVPSSLNNLTNLDELNLSNNILSGPFPNLTGTNHLGFLDLSNNSFDVSSFPSWLSTLKLLSTISLENIQLRGQVPAEMFSLTKIQIVKLMRNQLNGTLDIGPTHSNRLQLVNLQNNSISDYMIRPEANNVDVKLSGNPICNGTTPGPTPSYCMVS